ncbi:anti-sigma factor [uncultured Modestobacter sp.]|uniref:anti-sigma factor family protein n=1 Tax=uncultured Modestobacter sp. TaxID=380048 RepID=UPI00263354F4|nr:anti-sigma factor [uncultured Modestobacter sp.]
MSISESHLAQEAIAALVDGELSGGAAGRAARHLGGCAQCRMAVAAQREAKDALQRGVDLDVPCDLLSRLKAIPFTADVPGSGGLGTVSAGADGLTTSGLGGSWAIPLSPAEPPARVDGSPRWLRRGVTGALAGLGLGVAVLAVGLPAGEVPADEVARPGQVAGPVSRTVPTERTDIVPPVVRAMTVGATTTLPPDGTP